MMPASLPSSALTIRVGFPPWRESIHAHDLPQGIRSSLHPRPATPPPMASISGCRMIDEADDPLRQILHIGPADGQGRLVALLGRLEGRPAAPRRPFRLPETEESFPDGLPWPPGSDGSAPWRRHTAPSSPCGRRAQGSPSVSSTMCPTSPAKPMPRYRRPSRTSPPPMPVPRVITTRLRQPRPTPCQYSPKAAQSASFPRCTGTSRYWAKGLAQIHLPHRQVAHIQDLSALYGAGNAHAHAFDCAGGNTAFPDGRQRQIGQTADKHLLALKFALRFPNYGQEVAFRIHQPGLEVGSTDINAYIHDSIFLPHPHACRCA